MADNDILLRVGIDTTPAERDLADFQAKLRSAQQQAATTQAPGGGQTRIAQLPVTAQRQLFDTTPLRDASGELNKQQQTQKRLIDQRARLIALAQQEARIVAQAGGGTASRADLGRIRSGAESALAKSLGLDQLTPQIKGQITKTINALEAQFSAALSGLSGTQLQNRFRQLANPVLQQVGIEEPTRVRQASTIVREADVAEGRAAKQREAQADERSAQVAEQDARQSAADSQAQQAADKRTTRAKQQEAAVSERTLTIDRLREQVARGALTAAEASARAFQFGLGSNVDFTADVPRQVPRNVDNDVDVDNFDAAERGLIQALIEKRSAVEAQTAIITSNLGEFRAAEEALIAALLGKATALRNQTGTIGATPVAESTRATRERVARREEVISEPAPKKERTGPRPLGEEDGLDWDQSTVRQNEAALRNDTEELVEHSSLVDRLNDAVRRNTLSADQAAQVLRTRGVTPYEHLERFRQTEVLAARDERERQTRQARLAMERANMPLAQRFEARPVKVPSGFLAGMANFENRLRDFDLIIPTSQQWQNLRNRPDLGKIEDFKPDFDQVAAANQVLAQATAKAATQLTLEMEGLVEELAQMRAITAAFNQRLAGATSMAILNDPILREQYQVGAAENKVARRVLQAGTEANIAGDEALQRQLVQADLELLGFRKAQAAQIAAELAADPQRLRAAAEATVARQRSANAERELAQSLGALDTATERRILSMRESITAEERILGSNEGRRLVQRRADLQRRRRDIIAGVNPETEGWVAKTTRRFGYRPTGGDNLAQFFGGGALASLRYGLPSMLLYGAASGISDTIREAEELQYNLSRLEGQFNATFGGSGDFSRVRSDILDIAQNTGLAADEIANLQIQITGAFGQANVAQRFGSSDPQEFVQDQVKSAAKLAQTIGLPLEEITDGLTAASLAFDASFEEIGDVALALEEQSGVLARETVSFIGDIAPVAQEAGYELEEFAAMAAVAQQRSGRSGAALAESFGRVIPAITEQKDKLLELAAIDPSLATDKFFDAIRTNDAGAILEQIGRSYENMTTEAQQATVGLLGGRREAQAIIPALVNRGLIDEYTRAAEEGAGTLEERFLKVQETLTNAMQRLGEAVRQFGVVLLEAGLTETFETLIDLAKLFLGALTPIVGVVGQVNELLGGWPLAIALATAAYKVFNKTIMTRQPLDPATGLPLIDPNTNRPVPRVSRFDREPRTGLREPSRFRQNLLQQNYGVAGGALGPYVNAGQIPTRNLMRGAGIRGTAGAGVKGILQFLGGGSMAAGGTFLGITALTSLYGWANSQADRERAKLDELEQAFEQGNANIDLDIPQVRRNRVDELRAQAEDARKAYGGWAKFWGDIFGIMEQEELLLAQAEFLDSSPEFQEAFEIFSQSSALRQDVFKQFQVRLGKNTGALRDIVNEFNELPDAIIREVDGVFQLYSADDHEVRTLDANDTRYFREIADVIGVDPTDLDLGFLEAALEGDDGASVLALAGAEADAVDKYGREAQQQAELYVAAMHAAGMGDADIARRIEEIAGLVDQLPELEESKIKAGDLEKAYQLGILTYDEYISRLQGEIDTQIRLIQQGDDTVAQEGQILDAYRKIDAARKQQSDAILERQEVQRKIAEVLGGGNENDVALISYMQNVANLANPQFSDLDDRLQAAMDLIEAKKAVDVQIAVESGNVAELERLMSEGSEIPPEARAILFRAQLDATSPEFQELIVKFNAVKQDILTRISSIGGDDTAGLDGALVGAAQNAGERLKEMFDIDAGLLAENVFTDVFDDGVLSGDMQGQLSSMLQGLLSQAEDPSLTPDQQAEIQKAIAFIVALMNYAGMGAAAIAGAAGNNPNLTPGAIQGIIDTNPIVGSIKKFASVQENERVQDWAESGFELRRAQAQRNSVELARIQQDEAEYQRKQAETKSGLEREAARNRAAAAQLEADNALADAVVELNNSTIAYFQSLARVRGDLVGASRLEEDRIRNEIERAKATGDPNLDALRGQLAEQQEETRRIGVADVTSGYELQAAIAEANGDAVAAAQANLDKALAERDSARGTQEINQTEAAVEQARAALRQAELQRAGLGYDLMAAMAEADGDIIGAAKVRLANAERILRGAVGPQAWTQATIAVLQARTAVRQAEQQLADLNYQLFSAMFAGEDPLGQARVAEAAARDALARAVGPMEIKAAELRLIDAQRQVRDAMQDARYAMFELRQAELNAMGDEVGAAQVAAEIARQQLADAIAVGAGDAEIRRRRAAVIDADAAARDAVFQDKMDEYKWLLDMGRITQSQYINYLEGLKSTLIPGTKQFKDLELTIKQLKDGISGDLQMNLPTSLALPTLYEVRRLAGTGAANAPGGTGTTIGYQDQRVQNVQVTITKDMSEGQVLAVLNEALGAGRNGYGPRRY